jgi:hypothetical protein
MLGACKGGSGGRGAGVRCALAVRAFHPQELPLIMCRFLPLQALVYQTSAEVPSTQDAAERRDARVSAGGGAQKTFGLMSSCHDSVGGSEEAKQGAVGKRRTH